MTMAVDRDALIKFLKGRGYEVNTGMDSEIELWKSWYKGKVDSFHSYRLYNGVNWIRETMFSMQLGKTTSEQVANFLFNEKVGISIDDGSAQADREATVEAQFAGVIGDNPTAEFVRNAFDQNDMYVKINEMQERKSAYGTVVYIPYYSGERIRENFILSDSMVPLSWENGTINELCVYSPVTVLGAEYVYVQLFTLSKNPGGLLDAQKPTYTIENILLKRKTEDRAKTGNVEYEAVDEISAVPGYENVDPVIDTKSTARPFVVDRLNIANNIDPDSPFGLSIFANAIDPMKMCDTVFDSYVNEFILGRKRIMVAEEAMGSISGKPGFDPNEKVFYRVPVEMHEDGKPFIQEMDMKIRAEDHRRAMQDALSTFGHQCGLGNNLYDYSPGGPVTATQVVSENSDLFRAIKKHEIILESVLVDLIRLHIEVGVRNNMAEGLNPGSKITIRFDDSIIEDKDQEIRRRMAEVAAGLYDPVAYMAWRFGVTRDAARMLMPSMPEGNQEEGVQ